MENKYYLDEQGLTALVQLLSNIIKSHTTREVQLNQLGNIINPDYFITAQAVKDFLGNILTINQDISQKLEENEDYTVSTSTSSYNGQDNLQLNFPLVTANDIRAMFEE